MWYCDHPFEQGCQVLVIRHAHRPEIPPGRFGHELSLTEEGEKASLALGEKLSRTVWGEVHSSPLIRCRQTAGFFLRGAKQKIPIIHSKMLGDPGPFISDLEKAGPIFLKKTPQEIVRQLISLQSVPGMRTLEEGGKLFADYLKTIKTFPCLMVTHDSIISLLSAYFFKPDMDFPAFLDGFCITLQDSELIITKRLPKRT